MSGSFSNCRNWLFLKCQSVSLTTTRPIVGPRYEPRTRKCQPDDKDKNLFNRLGNGSQQYGFERLEIFLRALVLRLCLGLDNSFCLILSTLLLRFVLGCVTIPPSLSLSLSLCLSLAHTHIQTHTPIPWRTLTNEHTRTLASRLAQTNTIPEKHLYWTKWVCAAIDSSTSPRVDAVVFDEVFVVGVVTVIIYVVFKFAFDGKRDVC